jgi:starch synthase (maltosyl-transferring)
MARSTTKMGAVMPPPDLEKLAASRVAIEAVDPEIDGGRFPARSVVGRPFMVEADVFCDGHDTIRAALLHRREGSEDIHETEMTPLVNDRWQATVTFDAIGPWGFTIVAWRDLFADWRKGTAKKIDAGQDVTLEMEEARQLIAAAEDAKPRPSKDDRQEMKRVLRETEDADTARRTEVLMSDAVLELMLRAGPRTNLTRYDRELAVMVDRELAAFSAWYELFPRSWGKNGRHGTFLDVIDRLDYVTDLGFDVLYFPPIHPIGTTNRKGKNNSLTPGPDDPGSPYAIGSPEGGHMAVHPELGTMKDFEKLVRAAREKGLEIALDIALNASPDHPWIREHPEWFDWRPDGTIKYAENPPKKYEDIVNFHFYREAIPDIWYAMRDMFRFWVKRGVTIFRVDNPHTKPYPFWEWLIREVRADYPECIFLAEAFTRPKVMKRLAKLGFNQSYSYFTWRNTKHELTEYLTELTTEDCRHYMRPNFFVNTPDINPVPLQTSGRPGFRTRTLLAASLAGNYGIYNGVEISEGTPLPGREEYMDSEKYQLRQWDFDQEGHIKDDIRLFNKIRRENPALREFTSLKFFSASDDAVLYYGKFDPTTDNYVLFHVLLDPHAGRQFVFEVPLWEFGLPDHGSIAVEDLVGGHRFDWQGKVHSLSLDPHSRPYAIWRLTAPGASA